MIKQKEKKKRKEEKCPALKEKVGLGKKRKS
jgi:hypothetical protein